MPVCCELTSTTVAVSLGFKKDLNLKALSKFDGLATYISIFNPVMLFIFPARLDFEGSKIAIFKTLPSISKGIIS